MSHSEYAEQDKAKTHKTASNSSSIDSVNNHYIETARGLNMKMVYVEGGNFLMGRTTDRGNQTSTIKYPIRKMSVDSYYIGAYEITQRQWKRIMGNSMRSLRKKYEGYYDHKDYSDGSNYPAYCITWEEAQEFCQRLSKITGKHYALPTEAQWEYAARGGTESNNKKFSGSDLLDDVGWHIWNSNKTHRPVGQKQSNELGIYDMSGNVAEWCLDEWETAMTDTINPTERKNLRFYIPPSRVRRGGSCFDYDYLCGVSDRERAEIGERLGNRSFRCGFRIVLIP